MEETLSQPEMGLSDPQLGVGRGHVIAERQGDRPVPRPVPGQASFSRRSERVDGTHPHPARVVQRCGFHPSSSWRSCCRSHHLAGSSPCRSPRCRRRFRLGLRGDLHSHSLRSHDVDPAVLGGPGDARDRFGGFAFGRRITGQRSTLRAKTRGVGGGPRRRVGRSCCLRRRRLRELDAYPPMLSTAEAGTRDRRPQVAFGHPDTTSPPVLYLAAPATTSRTDPVLVHRLLEWLPVRSARTSSAGSSTRASSPGFAAVVQGCHPGRHHAVGIAAGIAGHTLIVSTCWSDVRQMKMVSRKAAQLGQYCRSGTPTGEVLGVSSGDMTSSAR